MEIARWFYWIVKKMSRSVLSGLKTLGEFLHLIIRHCDFFFNRLNISDIDQLILALILRFGVILV